MISYPTQEPRVSESLARFARTHLRTPAQRAVYRTVGARPDAWWSATEIADHTGTSVLEVDQVLRGFAAAGILHDRAGPAGRRYSWHRDLRYVFDGTSPTGELIDPICGMPVAADSPHVGHATDGAALRFCSQGCLAAHRRRSRRR